MDENIATTLIPITPEQKIRAELEKNKLADVAIADMKSRFEALTVSGIEDKEGLKKVHDARMEVRDARLGIQKYCKAARATALAYQKAVIAEENRLVALIEPLETYLQEQESVVEKEKERLRQIQKEEEEKKKKARIAQLIDLQMNFDGTAYFLYGNDTLRITLEQIDIMIDERFEEFVSKVRIEFEANLLATEKRLAEAKAEKERQDRIAAELAHEAKRLEDLKKEQLAQQLAIQKQQQEKEAALKAEADRIEKEKKAIEDARIKAEQDAKHAAELEEAKKAAAAKAIEDEKKRIQEAKLKAEEEERLRQEAAARQEALKPDKQKLIEYADAIMNCPIPQIQSEEAKALLNNAAAKFAWTAKELKTQTKLL